MSDTDTAQLLKALTIEADLSFDEPRDGFQLSVDANPDHPCVFLKCTVCGGPPVDRAYLYSWNLRAVADDFRAAAAQHRHGATAAAVQPDPGSST